MAKATLVSVEEYLASAYSPDRDYVNGVLGERNVGEKSHSEYQGGLYAFFRQHRKAWNLFPYVEWRVQVGPERFRVPDVCLVPGPEPTEEILRRPPLVCVEILSPSDTVHALQERIDDYLAFGVRYVWVIDPLAHRLWVHTAAGASEAADGVARIPEVGVEAPLRAFLD